MTDFRLYFLKDFSADGRDYRAGRWYQVPPYLFHRLSGSGFACSELPEPPPMIQTDKDAAQRPQQQARRRKTKQGGFAK